MKYFKYLIIGIIQGLTEPLPISSSAHMVFINHYLSLPPMSLGFECIVNFASTLAIFVFFFKDIKKIFINCIYNKNDSYLNRGYLKKLIFASIPVVIGGILLNDLIDSNFLTLFTCGISLIITGIILFYGRLLLRNSNLLTTDLYSPKSYMMIGLSQGVALIPGLSRSGMTLIAGLNGGNNIKSSLKFSFFLYLIASLGAFVLSLFKLDFESINIGYLLISCLGAFAMTLFSLKWFYNKMGKKLLTFLTAYAIIIGTINLIISLI